MGVTRPIKPPTNISINLCTPKKYRESDIKTGTKNIKNEFFLFLIARNNVVKTANDTAE